MKTFRLIGKALLALVMGVGFAACSDGSDELDNPTKKQEESAAITFGSEIQSNGIAVASTGGEQSVSFTTSTDWTLSVAPTASGTAWCVPSSTIGSKGNSTVTFTIQENTEYDDRSVAVTIKAGNTSKTFTVTQKQKDAVLLTANKFEVGQDGGTIKVEVKSNVDYQIEVAATAKSWITEGTNTRALTSHNHTFTIAANEEFEKREGEIYVKSGDKTEVVTVYQASGAVVLLTKSEYAVSDKGETITVNIQSNFEYDVKMPDVDWISSEATTRAMSSHSLKYIISPNETYDSRSAQIVYYDKKDPANADTLTIVQAQKDAIVISKKTYEIGVDGGTIEVELASNIDYTVSIDKSGEGWIKQVNSTITRALTNTKLYFEVAVNDSLLERVGTISISNGESAVNEVITITQSGTFSGVVEVKTPGTLNKLLVDVMTEISTLKVIGDINSTDLMCLINMAKGSACQEVLKGNTWTEFFFHSGKLSHLDLYDANLVYDGVTLFVDSQCQHGVRAIAKDGKSLSYCFRECSLKSIVLPKNLKSLGDYAFYHCSQLESVTFPEGLEEIGVWAFAGTKLREVTISRGCDVGRHAFYGDPLESVIVQGETSIEYSAFEYCRLLKSVTFNGACNVDSCAFYHCSQLESIDLSLTRDTIIESQAFCCCKSLKSISLPKTIKCIEDNAFSYCESLKSISFPETVEFIGSSAFSECKSLTSITLSKKLKEIDERAFYKCEALKTINIPSVTEIQGEAFSYCENLESVYIGENVVRISNDAFESCPAIKEVHCFAVHPPQIGSTVFPDEAYTKAVLYVPKGSRQEYVDSDFSQYFANIVEME